MARSKISEFAHIIYASILAGEGMMEALVETVQGLAFPYCSDRALLIHGEMTTKESLCTENYT